MPIYEYRCQRCEHRFEELVRGGDTPQCPQCDSRKLEKQMSAFAVGAAGAAPAEAQCGTCGMQPGSCMRQ